MVYLLAKKFALDSFRKYDNSLIMTIRASVAEINNVMRNLYGGEKLEGSKLNSSIYNFEAVKVHYITGSNLSVKVGSRDKKEIGRLEDLSLED